LHSLHCNSKSKLRQRVSAPDVTLALAKAASRKVLVAART
jgi:hypothetical protein